MSESLIACERSSCQNNNNGVCALANPKIAFKEAYADCFDHVNKNS